MQRRSNTQRRSIASAAKSLEHYDDTDVRSNVVDCLTDLRHFVDFYGLDMYDLLDVSYTHYTDEVNDARLESDARVTTHGE